MEPADFDVTAAAYDGNACIAASNANSRRQVREWFDVALTLTVLSPAGRADHGGGQDDAAVAVPAGGVPRGHRPAYAARRGADAGAAGQGRRARHRRGRRQRGAVLATAAKLGFEQHLQLSRALVRSTARHHRNTGDINAHLLAAAQLPVTFAVTGICFHPFPRPALMLRQFCDQPHQRRSPQS